MRLCAGNVGGFEHTASSAIPDRPRLGEILGFIFLLSKPMFCVNLRGVFFSDTHEENHGEKMLNTRARFRAVKACLDCDPDVLNERDREVFKEIIDATEEPVNLAKQSEDRADAIRLREIFSSVPEKAQEFEERIKAATHVFPSPDCPEVAPEAELFLFTNFLALEGVE